MSEPGAPGLPADDIQDAPDDPASYAPAQKGQDAPAEPGRQNEPNRDQQAPQPGPWRVVTVGGLAGTGTTTLCKLLEERFGLPYVYAGRIFRDEARRRGLSLAAFGALCQEDPEVDQALDCKQVELMQEADRGDGIIMEGRLAGWMAHRHRIHALKVWIVCGHDERMRRITDRDGGDLGDQIEATRERERSEADRYARYYSIDLGDLSPYDLVLDSTHRLPADLAEEVERAFRTV